MGLIPSSWIFDAPMQRIICHWTAGSYNVSGVDKEHYHIIIDGDGKVHRGYNDIDDNLSCGDGIYAAHTWGLNTASIGVTVCCMAGARQHPFRGGKFPMKKVQWETMIKVVAELCEIYKLPVDEKHVLQHGEVTEVYGIDQWGKWDVMVLPWEPGLSGKQVANLFRQKVREAMSEEVVEEHPKPLSKLKIFWHPKSKSVRIFQDDKELTNLDSFHVALQIREGKVTAAKLNGLPLDPKALVSGSIEMVYGDPD